jgi:hypothetical protein
MLMRGIGNLCIGGGTDSDYDAARLAGLLVTGVLTARGTTPSASVRDRSAGLGPELRG